MDIEREDQVILSLYPSIQEIKESALTNSYLGGLDEFYESIDSLLKSFETEFFKLDNPQDREKFPTVQKYTDIFTDKGKEVARNAPPAIAEIIMYLGTSGIAVAFYELLRLWVESKNGRKIRVKIGDFELETTQMSEKEFQRLFEILNEKRKSDELQEKQDELRAKFLSEGFILIDSKQKILEQRELNRVVLESISKATGKQ